MIIVYKGYPARGLETLRTGERGGGCSEMLRSLTRGGEG